MRFDEPSSAPVPLAAARLLQHAWRPIDADYYIRLHAMADVAAGYTCVYALRGGLAYDQRLSRVEALAMHRAGAWPQEFGYEHGGAFFLNQHAMHSVHQFLFEAGQAWARHLRRMAAIRGTPAGRVLRQHETDSEGGHHD